MSKTCPLRWGPDGEAYDCYEIDCMWYDTATEKCAVLLIGWEIGLKRHKK